MVVVSAAAVSHMLSMNDQMSEHRNSLTVNGGSSLTFSIGSSSGYTSWLA